MAFTPLVPATLNASITQGQAQAVQSGVVQNFAGAPIDLSAFVSLVAKAVPTVPGVNTADISFGTVTASSGGVITLMVDTTDLASSSPGSATLIIEGKPTSGDHSQILCRGTLTLQAG